MIESRGAVSPINHGLADRTAALLLEAYSLISECMRNCGACLFFGFPGSEELKPSVCSTLLFCANGACLQTAGF